ncbi:unnamed protein product [Prunus armeniaca]
MIGVSRKHHVASSCSFLSALTSTMTSCYINNLQATAQAMFALGLALIGGSHPLPKLDLESGRGFLGQEPPFAYLPPLGHFQQPPRARVWGGGKSPNASSSNKGWPGQGRVHEPGLARRQEEPELQPEGALTSA